MTCQMKPLACDPGKLTGLSEKLIVSHYENNYGGAVKRLNAITAHLAGIDIASAPVFVLNGLKREELIAANSVILHETYFDSLGADGKLDGDLEAALTRDFGSVERWSAEFTAMGKALGGGSGWVLLSYSPRLGRLTNQWASDHTHLLTARRFSRWICTSIPTTSISVPRLEPMWTPSCRTSTGLRWRNDSTHLAVNADRKLSRWGCGQGELWLAIGLDGHLLAWPAARTCGFALLVDTSCPFIDARQRFGRERRCRRASDNRRVFVLLSANRMCRGNRFVLRGRISVGLVQGREELWDRPGWVSSARSSTQTPDATSRTAVNQNAGTISPRDCAIKPRASAPIA